MHELFMTAIVSDRDAVTARGILEGFCSMAEVHTITRVLFYQGPEHAAGFKTNRGTDKTPIGRAWNDLNQFLNKQSFILQARYALQPDDFQSSSQSTPAPSNNLDRRLGTLRWNDIADPLPRGVFHTQRRMLEIRHQDHLPTILAQNKHEFKSECIQESYLWHRNGIEFSLERRYQLPEDASGEPKAPRAVLPPVSELVPLDTSWVLHMRAFVPDRSPERTHEAVETMMALRYHLRRIFDFKQFDRRVFDTRVMGPPSSNMPLPLPQHVTINQV
ncbi:hypothetical protein VTK73DRAFT_4732 [Phialemonium thermophilum]|uniref:Mediator of RNA polymerase II transcription subunit 18 n=1 Tax=Phialemonium thermophilum TaxID=223376 RepID=A0ABR3WSI9_9PEZI